MKTCGIYGIFSLDEKVLVGSGQNIPKRWHHHRYLARRNIHPNPHFQSAWNKYGEGTFEFRILEECSEDMLIVREDAWMGKLDSMNPEHGYNMWSASRMIWTDEMRRHASQAKKGKVQSEETKAKISLAHMGKPGRAASPETKLKMSLSRKGKTLSDDHKKHLSESLAGRVFSESHKEHLANSIRRNPPMLGKHQSAEVRKKISASNIGKHHKTEEQRAVLRLSAQSQWARQHAAGYVSPKKGRKCPNNIQPRITS